MPDMRRQGWMYSRSRRRSGTSRARELFMISLATLGIVLLFDLVSHGLVVIDALPPDG